MNRKQIKNSLIEVSRELSCSVTNDVEMGKKQIAIDSIENAIRVLTVLKSEIIRS